MANSEKAVPSDLIARFDQLLDEESSGQWTYWIPVSNAVKLLMSEPETMPATIASICRQILRRLLEGDSEGSINRYLNDTIGFDSYFAKCTIGQTMDSAKFAAEIIDGKMTQDQAVAEMMGAKGADRDMILKMLAMVLKFYNQSDGRYSSDDLRKIWREPEETPATPGFCTLNLLVLASWPILWLGFGYRWWTSLLIMLGLFWILLRFVLPAISNAVTRKKVVKSVEYLKRS